MKTIAIFIIAAVFLWAGLEKIRNLGATASTIVSLGMPSKFAPPIALFISVSEIITALLVLFKPNYILTHLGIILLSGLFAISGLVAIAFSKSIKCNCFGINRAGYLGKTQIISFPVWIFGVSVLRYMAPNEFLSLETGAVFFAAVSLTITAIRGIEVLEAHLRARSDRLSAQEMFLWLR